MKNKIFVSNLKWKVKGRDLKELFSTVGKVENAWIEKREGGQSRGFGYVVFEKAESAEKAKARYNHTTQWKRLITVNFAIKKNPSPKSSSAGDKKGDSTEAKDNPIIPQSRKRRKLMKRATPPKIKGTMIEAVEKMSKLVTLLAKYPWNAKQVRVLWKTTHMLSHFLANPSTNEDKLKTEEACRREFPEMVGKLTEALKGLSTSGERLTTLRAGGKECKFLLLKKVVERLNAAVPCEQYITYEDTLISEAIRWEKQLFDREDKVLEKMDIDMQTPSSINEIVRDLWCRRNLGENWVAERMTYLRNVQNALDGVNVIPHGSCCTLLAHEKGDLDIGLQFEENPPSVHNMKFMAFSHKHLTDAQQKLYAQNIPNKLVAKTRIPILLLKQTTVPCELSIHNPDDTRRLKLINALCQRRPEAGPFLLYIKHWARSRKLSETHLRDLGCLNSFGFVCLGMISLKAFDENSLTSLLASFNLKEKTSLINFPIEWPSGLWQDFLPLLIIFFDLIIGFRPRIQMFSTRAGRVLEKKGSSCDVIIVDPVDPVDNPARNLSYGKWIRIRREAQRAKRYLEKGEFSAITKLGKDDDFKMIRQLFLS